MSSFQRHSFVVSQLLIFWTCLLGASHQAFGFFSDFEHLSDSEGDELMRPHLIDSEYQSDILTFEVPIAWNLPWLLNTSVFQYSAGSLSSTRFGTWGRFKLEKPLSEKTFFRLSYVDRGDYISHRQSFIFELGYKVSSAFRLTAYGQPDTRKSEDDIGLAAEWHWSPSHWLRVFHTWVDFSHNKRNEASDFYEQRPKSYGVVWRKASAQGSFHEVALRHDTKSVRVFEEPVAGQYAQEGIFFSLLGRYQLSPRLNFLQLKTEVSHFFEEDTRTPTFGVDAWKLDRASVWVQHSQENSPLPLYGLKYVYNEWQGALGNVIHNGFMPHLWLTLFKNTKHNGRLGYEATWHRGQGPKSLRSLNDLNDTWQQRLNYRHEIRFSPEASLQFLLSFDLDAIDRSPWEGGNLRFHMTL